MSSLNYPLKKISLEIGSSQGHFCRNTSQKNRRKILLINLVSFYSPWKKTESLKTLRIKEFKRIIIRCFRFFVCGVGRLLLANRCFYLYNNLVKRTQAENKKNFKVRRK